MFSNITNPFRDLPLKTSQKYPQSKATHLRKNDGIDNDAFSLLALSFNVDRI
jgi:hypothetical protein